MKGTLLEQVSDCHSIPVSNEIGADKWRSLSALLRPGPIFCLLAAPNHACNGCEETRVLVRLSALRTSFNVFLIYNTT